MSTDRDAHSHSPADERRDAGDRGGRTQAAGTDRLSRLRDLHGYEVADGYPDIRGWDVKTSDGATIGEVEDLIVDLQALRVRYVVVELARQFRNATHTASLGEAIRRASRRVAEAAADVGDAPQPDAGEGHTLIPVGGVRLDDRHDEVIVEHLTSEQVVGLPRYGGLALTDEYESAVRNRLFEDESTGLAGAAGAEGYEGTAYDDQRLFAGRRAPTDERRPEAVTGEAEVRVPVAREEIIVRAQGATDEPAAPAVPAEPRRERANADDVAGRVEGNPASRPGPGAIDRR